LAFLIDGSHSAGWRLRGQMDHFYTADGLTGAMNDFR
jgi:hypothetical protein